jgi:hypothetical protein
MKHLSQQEIYEAFDRALKEVAADYEAGTLDMSGRYYTDAELAQEAEAFPVLRDRRKAESKTGTAA